MIDRLHEVADRLPPSQLEIALNELERARQTMAVTAEGAHGPELQETLGFLSAAIESAREAYRCMQGGGQAIRAYADNIGGVAPDTQIAPTAQKPEARTNSKEIPSSPDIPDADKLDRRIVAQEKQFRSMAELVWTRNTIYPRDEFFEWEPKGQCGVTNFGLGVWLVWRGLARPQHLFYAEGSVYDADGDLIDDKHAWLLMRTDHSQTVTHSDLTLDQYEGVGWRVVASNVACDINAAKYTKYDIWVETDDQPRTPKVVQYEPRTLTPLTEYDTAAFKGRLETFLGSCYNSTKFMGHQAVAGAVSDLWLPNNSKYDADARRAILSTRPCDAQLP